MNKALKISLEHFGLLEEYSNSSPKDRIAMRRVIEKTFSHDVAKLQVAFGQMVQAFINSFKFLIKK